MAGGMHHVVDGARQIIPSRQRQVPDAIPRSSPAQGGIMSEQVALLMRGD
jgi:hypothetical protein